jgi:hypothetical protein
MGKDEVRNQLMFAWLKRFIETNRSIRDLLGAGKADKAFETLVFEAGKDIRNNLKEAVMAIYKELGIKV